MENYKTKEQPPVSLYGHTEIGMHWDKLTEILADTTWSKMLANNPPRWQPVIDSEPDLLETFNVRSDIIPNAKTFFKNDTLNDADSVQHLDVVRRLAQCYIQENYSTYPELRKVENVNDTIFTCLVHDLQEALVGDRVSGTKTEEDDLLEHQAFKFQMQHNVAKIGVLDEIPNPNLEKAFNRSLDILLANPDFDSMFDLEPKNIPNRVNFRDHLEARNEVTTRQLHQHYKNIHLGSFVVAVESATRNNPNSELLANLKTECLGRRQGHLERLNRSNPFFKKLLKNI